MNTSVVVNQMLMLFFPVVIGYIIIKLGVVKEEFTKNLSSFIFNVTLPCAIISALQFDFDRQILIKSALLIVISAIIIVFSWIFGLGTAKILKAKHSSKSVIVYSLMFSNFSFMGYPIAQAFMGDEGLMYATMFTLPLYVMVQSWGVALINSEGERKFKATYILNAPLIAAVIGFILFLTGLRFPTAIDGTISMLGSMTTPLAMVVVGLSLSAEPLKNAFTSIRFYVVALLRLVVLPLIVFYVLKALNINIDICRVSAIITMMPVAANIIVTSATYGKDTTDPARAVLLTTVLSVITIPLMGFILF
ncbi:MAG: AEC family transporter [Clostridia bacterium]|nr:AEC family transporter [Clostridia bacterium]